MEVAEGLAEEVAGDAIEFVHQQRVDVLDEASELGQRLERDDQNTEEVGRQRTEVDAAELGVAGDVQAQAP